MFKSTFSRFRVISYFEGLSYFILVFIAMPLKYLGGNTQVLQILGMLHGMLFILFCITLVQYAKEFKLEKSLLIDFFIYSLYPFGFILIENNLKEEKWNNMIK